MNTTDSKNTEIVILMNMWDWWFLFHFSYKIATNNLAHPRSHKVIPHAPFNLPYFVPHWNWLRLYQCLFGHLRPKWLNLGTLMIGACETDWNSVSQEKLNHSYVTCRTLIVFENLFNCYEPNNKNPKLQCNIKRYTIFIFFYIQIIRIFEWHNDPLSKMYFFFHTNIHIIYFKIVWGNVYVQFASWPNVMKTKFAAKNWIFCNKCDISKTVKYIAKHRDRFGDYLEQNHSRTQNWNQASHLKIESKNLKKGILPKAIKQCQIAEIWNEKNCDIYCLTVVYKTMKFKFEYRKLR